MARRGNSTQHRAVKTQGSGTRKPGPGRGAQKKDVFDQLVSVVGRGIVLLVFLGFFLLIGVTSLPEGTGDLGAWLGNIYFSFYIFLVAYCLLLFVVDLKRYQKPFNKLFVNNRLKAPWPKSRKDMPAFAFAHLLCFLIQGAGFCFIAIAVFRIFSASMGPALVPFLAGSLVIALVGQFLRYGGMGLEVEIFKEIFKEVDGGKGKEGKGKEGKDKEGTEGKRGQERVHGSKERKALREDFETFLYIEGGIMLVCSFVISLILFFTSRGSLTFHKFLWYGQVFFLLAGVLLVCVVISYLVLLDALEKGMKTKRSKDGIQLATAVGFKCPNCGFSATLVDEGYFKCPVCRALFRTSSSGDSVELFFSKTQKALATKGRKAKPKKTLSREESGEVEDASLVDEQPAQEESEPSLNKGKEERESSSSLNRNESVNSKLLAPGFLASTDEGFLEKHSLRVQLPGKDVSSGKEGEEDENRQTRSCPGCGKTVEFKWKVCQFCMAEL